jgi:transcriptional regulator with XRE-family HTH domain
MHRSAVSCLPVPNEPDPSTLFLRRFGRRLRLLRIERDLTQEEVGKAAGMNRTFIGKLERGQTGMNVDRLDDLAQALGLTPRDLIPRDDGY